MHHGSICDVYIFILVAFNGFFLAFGVISFAKLHKKLPYNVLVTCKYILKRDIFQKVIIIVINFCFIVGYLYEFFSQHTKEMHSVYGILNGVILLTFLYSYAINFSYRFHVNNKKLNLVASESDENIYKINNIVLTISLGLIFLFKYL